MKGSYEKPITFVGLMQYQINLLGTSSTEGKFTDEEPDNGWDAGGANSNEYHFDNIFWDEE